ncbi:MAG: TonB-dependent receptor [Spirochaetota bacterium]
MKRLLCVAVIAALSGLVAGPLFADVEIVVVASRIPEESRRTPAVVRVIPQEDIEQSDTVLDALSRVPNIRTSVSSPGDASAALGGFGENGFMRTLVLRDGVPLNNPDMNSINWRSIPLSRVERIEVLQGPASARYGDQAVAGVINIITKTPEPRLSVEASASVDTNLSNEQALSLSYGAVIDGPGGEDTEKDANAGADAGSDDEPGSDAPRFSLSADAVRSEYTPERERSDYDMWSTSLAGSAEIGMFSVRARGFYTPSAYQMPGGLTEDQFEDDPDQAVNEDDEIEQLEYGGEVSPEIALGRLTISAPLSAAVTESRTDFVSLSSYYDSGLTALDGSLLATYEAFLGPAVAFTPTLGLDVRRSTLEVDRYPNQEREATFFEASLVRMSYAPWTRLELSYDDLVIVEAGGRFEHAHLEASSDDDAIDGDDTHLPIAFDAGVSYLPMGEVKLSARYGRTFRYPALDEQVLYYGGGTFYDDIDPERGHSVTAGAEYDDGAVAVSVSPFMSWMADELVYDDAESRNVNATEARRRYGASAEASYTWRFVSVGAGYDYTRAEIAEGENEGNAVPLVPAHELSGRAGVELPLGFRVETDLLHASGYYKSGDDANEQDPVPERLEWDARLSWRSDFGLSTYVAARNITDDRTPTTVFYDAFNDKDAWYPMPERTVEVGASWSY